MCRYVHNLLPYQTSHAYVHLFIGYCHETAEHRKSVHDHHVTSLTLFIPPPKKKKIANVFEVYYHTSYKEPILSCAGVVSTTYV